ncbi:HAD family hydrolase [Halomonas lysinitropha]|uniref:6-phosphogluconate phosphatase n=1 Tax=Halomonas lysinitropha TaxID=2607506 RepID=A0A5K1I6P0_9GAMM|nr:HAD family phosphatase [Halomonas lysinitropha]VVZ97045.1 6-phosphogluconate phosphatase [Halomonas lysinitropha]
METLIFDCDGVLVDSEAIAEATLVELLGGWLPDLDADTVLSQALGMTTANILRHLEGQSRHRLPEEAKERVDQTIESRLLENLEAIDGVAEVIRTFRFPLAVVSNSRRKRVLASLATTRLDAVFGDAPIFTADQVERPKPDPELYLLAAREMGCTPAHCLVVEDSVSGVTAAHGAGMTVIGFTGASHVPPGQAERLTQAGAWRVLNHMNGLATLVDQWRAHRCASRTLPTRH